MSPSDGYILQLPPETILHVASFIDKPSDLIALAHTNSILRSYAVAKLYSRICLYRWSQKTIDVLDHLAKYPHLHLITNLEILPWAPTSEHSNTEYGAKSITPLARKITEDPTLMVSGVIPNNGHQ
jgi:hypothetical protein